MNDGYQPELPQQQMPEFILGTQPQLKPKLQKTPKIPHCKGIFHVFAHTVLKPRTFSRVQRQNV
jgi:hypothetical protein